MYAYLERKDKIIYDELLRCIVNECTNLSPVLGLVQANQNDAVFSSVCSVMDGLAYLCTLIPQFGVPLLNYFEETYISGFF